MASIPRRSQVLISRLTGVAEEMGAVLRRAAFCPNIKERADCSAALFTADGELLVQAEHIPVHLGSMPASVAAAIAAFGDDRCGPGEQVVLNDPFAGGTHLNDVTLVAPCSRRRRGWSAGWPTGPTTPTSAAWRRGRSRRTPPRSSRRGSASAGAAHRRGAGAARRRLPHARGAAAATSTPRSAPTSSASTGCADVAPGAPLDEVVAYGERRMRAALAALPDGTWRVRATCSTPPAAGPASSDPARIARHASPSTATRSRFDFTGTDAQRPATSTPSRR